MNKKGFISQKNIMDKNKFNKIILYVLGLFFSFLGFFGVNFANVNATYTSGLCSSRGGYGTCEPDNTSATYSFGTRFKNIYSGKFTNSSTWADLSKLPLRLGDVFIKAVPQTRNISTNANLVYTLKRTNTRKGQFSEEENKFLKDYLKNNYKTANGDKRLTQSGSEYLYSNEGNLYTNNNADLPSVFPVEAYAKVAKDSGFDDGSGKYFNYPIFDMYRYYLRPLWGDEYNNGNSDNWFMLKGAMIGYVDGKLYENDKYVGNTNSVQMSWIIGQAFGVSGDKVDLMRVLTYGAFVKKKELIQNGGKAYYFRSLVDGLIDDGTTASLISVYNLSTNQSGEGMLSNRYDMPLILGKEVGVVDYSDVSNNTVECKYIDKNKNPALLIKNPGNCVTYRSASDVIPTSELLPRYLKYTISDYRNVDTLVKSLWKIKNEANLSNSKKYDYILGGGSGNYFLQGQDAGKALNYYDKSLRADYGPTAYTNVFGSADYVLFLYKFLDFGIEYKEEQLPPPTYYIAFFMTGDYDKIVPNTDINNANLDPLSQMSFTNSFEKDSDNHNSLKTINVTSKNIQLNKFNNHYALLTNLSPIKWNTNLKLHMKVTYSNGSTDDGTFGLGNSSYFPYKHITIQGQDFYVIDLTTVVNSTKILDNSNIDSNHITKMEYSITGTPIQLTINGKNIVTHSIPPSPSSSGNLSGGTVSGTFDPQVRFIDNYEWHGYVRMSSDYENDYDKLEHGVSWSKYPINKLGIIITAKIEGDSYTVNKLKNDYRCIDGSTSNEVYCDVIDLVNKNFFKNYFPIKVKSKVCNDSGDCSEKNLGDIKDVFTSTYNNFGYGTIDDKAEIVGRQVYSAEKIFKAFNRAEIPAVSYSIKNTIENQMNNLGGSKFKIGFIFENENGNIKMAYDNAYIYTVNKPVKCSIKYTGPSQTSSDGSWNSLGNLVRMDNSSSGAITGLKGYVYDDDNSRVGSASNSYTNEYEVGLSSSSNIVSGSSNYPVKMKLVTYFNTNICSNSSQTIYPNIKICPSSVDINNIYVSKDTTGATAYKLKAYTTYPGSSCGSVSNEKVEIEYDGTSETISLNNCSISDSGVLECDFNLTSGIIKYINNQIDVDNIKYPLDTTLSFDWNSSTGGSGTSTKKETVKYQGTCIGSQPFFNLNEINANKIVGNDGYDTDNPSTVDNFIAAKAGNDRRLNKKRFKVEYMGCYKPTRVEFKFKNGNNELTTGILPNNNVSKLYVDTDGNAVNIDSIFSDADQVNEDRLNNPETKDIILNIGFKHMGIKNSPDDIKGNFTDVQNYINNNAIDGSFARPDIDMNVSLKLYQNNTDDTNSYEVENSDKVKFFGYCYPYAYLVPYNKKIDLTKAAILNNYKDSTITLQYRGCEPLNKIQLSLYGGILGKQGQSEVVNGDYKLLGIQQYQFDNGKGFADTMQTCNSVDADGDGTPCNSDIDRKAVEAYELVKIPFNVFSNLMLYSGKITDIKDPNVVYDFDNDNNIGFRKDNVLSTYFKDIVNNNYFKKDLDDAKVLYWTMYNDINSAKLRLDISATDTDNSNDIQQGTHDYKGFSTDKEITNYNRFTLEQFLFNQKPIILFDTFKVKFLNNASGKIEDKNTLNYTGMIDIEYKLSDKYPNLINSYDRGEYMKPYLLIQVFDPYNHEITLLKKIVPIKEQTDHLQIPLFFDKSYPDGIYTVKAQVFDKNDNKIGKDMFSSIFIKKEKPQVSIVLKELPDADAKKVNIYDVLNNGYVVDGKSLYNGGYLKAKIYLHNDINDYEHAKINGEDSLILYVNIDKGGNRAVIPKSDIHTDTRTGLKYATFYLVNRGIDNTLFGKVLEGINTISIKDNYGEKNLASINFNVIYTSGNGIPTPYLKEDVTTNRLLFTNILLESKDVKDVTANENGVNATSISIYNNNLWLNIGGIIYVKDFTGNTSLKINSNGYNKIRIKEGHLIKIKEYNINVNGVNHTIPGLISMDYDPINKVGFGFDKDGYLYYIDSAFAKKKLEKIADKVSDLYIERVVDGSYTLYVVNNGKLEIYNISGYNTDLWKLSKDYGPNNTFNNTVYTNNIISIDKHGDLLYYIKTDAKGIAVVGFIPLYQTNLLININGTDKVINYGRKTSLNMNIYKEMLSPIATIGQINDSTGKKSFEITVKIPEKNNINIGGYITLDGKSSLLSGLGTTNMIPYQKVELYKDGNLIWTKNLDDTESEGKKDITIKLDYSTDTHMYVIKLITGNGKYRSIIIPVFHEVIRIPIAKGVIADGNYSGTVKILTKDKQILYSMTKDFMIANNTLYTDIPLYDSKFDNNNVFKGFNDIEGVQVVFYSNKGLINLYHPLKDVISDYSLYSYGLVEKGNVINMDKFVSPTEMEKMSSYANSQLNGYIKTDNLVRTEDIKDLGSFNWNAFGGLFVCIDKDTANKLKFTIKDKYWAIYNELQKINNNQLEAEKGYLTQQVLDRIKWIKETKLQTCPTNLGNKFINIKDLLDK